MDHPESDQPIDYLLSIEPDLQPAQQLRDHAQYVLERELAVSGKLLEVRKTASALLALVIGIGFIRVSLFQRSDEVIRVPQDLMKNLAVLTTIAIVAFAYGQGGERQGSEASVPWFVLAVLQPPVCSDRFFIVLLEYRDNHAVDVNERGDASCRQTMRRMVFPNSTASRPMPLEST